MNARSHIPINGMVLGSTTNLYYYYCLLFHSRIKIQTLRVFGANVADVCFDK